VRDAREHDRGDAQCERRPTHPGAGGQALGVLPTSFDDPRQQVTYDLTQALIGRRVIPTGLYRRSVDLLGDAGVTDLTTLIGYYTTVSLTLAAYDVPADAVGSKR
jgi:4-carboxymuconolactone decarboxylase